MLESLALFFIIVVGVCYSFKTLCFMVDRYMTHRAKVRFIALASVPTEIKKPRTKKKGK